MFEVNKKVTIYRRESDSAFAVKNRVQIALSYSLNDKIGSAIGAVSKMTERANELRAYMPDILGISPSDPTWGAKINDYWNSLSKRVPESGLPLEIGFRFDVDDFAKKADIDKLMKDHSLANEAAFGEYVMTKVDELEKYKYGTPLVVTDYLLWRYCLNYRDVANKIEDVSKSAHIRFYLHDEAVKQKMDEAHFALKTKAETKYYEILSDKNKVESILAICGYNILTFKNEIAKHKTLREIVDSKPQVFLNIEKDKKLQAKAFIEKCITLGILKRYPNTTTVVDVENNDTIGQDMDSALIYLDDAKHKDVLTRLQTMCSVREKEYISLPK